MSGDTGRKTASATFCGSLALALCLPSTADAQTVTPAIHSAFTDYDTRACAHRPGREVEDYGEWRCKGVNGMAVLVHAGDQRMTMSFGPRAKNEPAAGQTLQGFNDVYKARIEWRFVREGRGRLRPFAAIVRWNTSVLDDDDTPGKAGSALPKTVHGQVLVVTRLGPIGACHVGYVDALANPDANELARKIADERARTFRCDTDKPVIVGKTGPGFSSSAAAEKVDRP
jgi:hypothetical protein